VAFSQGGYGFHSVTFVVAFQFVLPCLTMLSVVGYTNNSGS